MLRRLAAALALSLALCGVAFGQGAVLNAGRPVGGHVPQFIGPSTQPVITDSGTAGGGALGANPSELGLTVRGTGAPPYANAGTGPNGTNFCTYDAPITSTGGFHYLCLGPNSNGGGMLSYGAGGGAAPLPFVLNLNGVSTSLPGGPCTLCGSIATQSANNVAITGGTISNVTLTNSNLTFTVGGDLAGTLPNPTFNLANAHLWGGQQSFTLPPIFTSLNGYVKANGAGQVTASPTVPTTDLSGALQAAQEPAHTGDVTNSAGSLSLALGNAVVGNTKLSLMPASTIKTNLLGAPAVPTDSTLAQILNTFIGPAGGTLIFNNGTTWTGLPVGSSQQVLTVSGGLPSWQPLPTGVRYLLNTISATALPNVQDSTSLTAAYSEYEIDIENLVPVNSNANCQILVQISGGTFPASGYVGLNRDATTATNAPGSSQNSSIACSAAVSNVAANNGANARFFIRYPSSSTGKVTWMGEGTSQSDSNPSQHIFTSVGRYDTAGAITGFQISFSAGNIASGTIKVYGWN